MKYFKTNLVEWCKSIFVFAYDYVLRYGGWGSESPQVQVVCYNGAVSLFYHGLAT